MFRCDNNFFLAVYTSEIQQLMYVCMLHALTDLLRFMRQSSSSRRSPLAPLSLSPSPGFRTAARVLYEVLARGEKVDPDQTGQERRKKWAVGGEKIKYFFLLGMRQMVEKIIFCKI